MTWRGAGVAVVVIAAVSACTHSDKAGKLPTPTNPASASPSAATPSYPPTAEGAADFVRSYYTYVDLAFDTGKTQQLRAASAPECEACLRLASSAEAIYGHGGRVEGVGYTIKFAVSPAVSGPEAMVDVGYAVGDSREFDKDGHVVDTTPGLSDGQQSVTLRRVGDSWKVTKIVRIGMRS